MSLMPAQRSAIAAELGISQSLLPKIIGGHRDNPRVATVQPLLDYFDRLDRGEIELPSPDRERNAP